MVFVIFALFFFFQAEDGIRDIGVTGVQTCALPILLRRFSHAVSFWPERVMPVTSRTRPLRKSSRGVPYPRPARISNGSSRPNHRFSPNLNLSSRTSVARAPAAIVPLQFVNVSLFPAHQTPTTSPP